MSVGVTCWGRGDGEILKTVTTLYTDIYTDHGKPAERFAVLVTTGANLDLSLVCSFWGPRPVSKQFGDVF